MKMGRRLLTKEERDVLILGALQPSGKHLSNCEIGHRLGITVSRVKTVIHQACVKLEANNRNQAILLALRRGEINLGRLFVLEELTQIFCTLGPDVLREIAHLVRQMQEGHLTGLEKQFIGTNRREDGVLTNRERDVVILASHGLTNQEMADQLCMSLSAVKIFLHRAFKKLGAHKKADAVLLAMKTREIGIDEMLSTDAMFDLLAPLGADTIAAMAQLLERQLGEDPVSSCV